MIGRLEALPPEHHAIPVEMVGYATVSCAALMLDTLIYWSLVGQVGLALIAAGCGYIGGGVFHYLKNIAV